MLAHANSIAALFHLIVLTDTPADTGAYRSKAREVTRLPKLQERKYLNFP